MPNPLLTIGHSSRTFDEFLELVQANEITAVADVRSSPYSRFTPHFNREELSKALKATGVEYVFVGNQLGGRPRDPACYRDGLVQYDIVATTDEFREGIKRVQTGLKTHRITLMCSERDPITCHRMLLVARHLRDSCEILHVIDPGEIETQQQAERRMLKTCGIEENNLFFGLEELIDEAYQKQAERVGYRQDRKEVSATEEAASS